MSEGMATLPDETATQRSTTVKLIIFTPEPVQYGALLAALAASMSRKGITETIKPGDYGQLRESYLPNGVSLGAWHVEEPQEEPPTFTPPHTPNPLDYECPVCDAPVGKYCSVASGRRGERRQVPWVHPAREERAQ